MFVVLFELFGIVVVSMATKLDLVFPSCLSFGNARLFLMCFSSRFVSGTDHNSIRCVNRVEQSVCLTGLFGSNCDYSSRSVYYAPVRCASLTH